MIMSNNKATYVDNLAASVYVINTAYEGSNRNRTTYSYKTCRAFTQMNIEYSRRLPSLKGIDNQLQVLLCMS